MRPLTTTSHAILGLLAIRPWATYELAKQMRRTMAYVWPRAESNLYAEPKRLAEAGLVDVATEHTGRRARTIYSLTPKGRKALEEWLEQPASSSRFESEALLKVLFGNYASKDTLLGHLRSIVAEAHAQQDMVRNLVDEYVTGQMPFPERLHVNTLILRFYYEQAESTKRWAHDAIEQVEQWPTSEKPHDAIALMTQLRELVDRDSTTPGPANPPRGTQAR